MQDNANNPKQLYSGYDIIVVPNLLEELINPVAFLQQIHTRLNQNGVVIIASTYQWNEQVKRENWPGGFKQDGEPFTSLDGITHILAEHFSLQQQPVDLQFVFRKTARVSEIRTSEVTVWKKK